MYLFFSNINDHHIINLVRYSKSVRGVVVVVDSADFVDQVRECSEVLYEVNTFLLYTLNVVFNLD